MKTFKQILILLILSLNILPLLAQEAATALVPESDMEEKLAYSYISEKRYRIIHELDGEVFIPYEYQLAEEEITKIPLGNIRISLLAQQVNIEGMEELGTFHILSKAPQKGLGYVYELMDGNNQPARLKVVTDHKKYVQLIYFFSKTLGEHSFFLAEKAAEEKAAEKNYFTSRSKYFVRTYVNLLERTFKPYRLQEKEQRMRNIKQSENISLTFKEKQILTPLGNFNVKEAETRAFPSKDFPSVKSRIEVKLAKNKAKVKNIVIYLNFKQEIEAIEVGNVRYFLMQ